MIIQNPLSRELVSTSQNSTHIRINKNDGWWMLLIGKLVWCNNFVQIIENQLIDNDKQQECANIVILIKMFYYMCKTLFKG